jgi:uracil phosphoribosyltransferase
MPAPPANVKVIDHPLVAHKLSLLRRKETPSSLFRSLVEEISMLLAYEVTRELRIETKRIDTPLATIDAPYLDGQKVAFVPILRAGNAMLEGMLALLPTARVWHIGIYRDHETLKAVEYYCKLPASLADVDVIVVDPMLATAASAAAAFDRLKKCRPRSLRFVCLISAPEGVQALLAAHPDVPIFTAAVDEKLNAQGYIVPGLGDAGDRIYGTS